MEPGTSRPGESRAKPTLISFSGMDGSGKSTAIAGLTSALKASGLRVTNLTYWDNVVILPRFRAKATATVFRGETGIGAPGKPVDRRDKNYRPWYASLGRSVLYLLDAIHLRFVLKKIAHADVIIFDRYIYDQMATLPLERALARGYARLLCSLAPRPDTAYLLDAEPEVAYSRKPEYPLAFLHQYRQSYLRVAALVGTITVIRPQPLDQTLSAILRGLSFVYNPAGEKIARENRASGPSLLPG